MREFHNERRADLDRLFDEIRAKSLEAFEDPREVADCRKRLAEIASRKCVGSAYAAKTTSANDVWGDASPPIPTEQRPPRQIIATTAPADAELAGV